MRNKVWQITTKEIDCEYWITESTFDDYNIGDFADFVEGINMTEDDEEEILECIDPLIKGVFKREGRVLTYLGAEDFVNDWLITIKDKVAELDNHNIKDYMTLWRVKHLFEDTHLQTDARIWTADSDYGTAEPFGEFIRDVYANAKVGDKFYIGGIVGFHF